MYKAARDVHTNGIHNTFTSKGRGKMNHIKQFFREKGLYLFCLAMVFAATAAGILALRTVVSNVACCSAGPEGHCCAARTDRHQARYLGREAAGGVQRQ